MGIGYCLIVPPDDQLITDIELRIHGHDMKSWVIGEVTT
jgi:phosphoribosylaminoimidazole (AIR) synthetase